MRRTGIRALFLADDQRPTTNDALLRCSEPTTEGRRLTTKDKKAEL